MILNPILMLFLTGISLVAGGVSLAQTDDWLSVIPFVVFISLFCLSLFVPEVKKAQLVAGYRVVLKTLTQVIKLTAEWLSAFAHYGARYLAQKRFEMGRARRAKSMVDG
jgi:uncharacterized membrane protein YtjA (UPF0391 family)